jgi:site-specific recombinase XerD
MPEQLPAPPTIDPNVQYALAYLLQAISSGSLAPPAIEPVLEAAPQPELVRKTKRQLPRTLSRTEMEQLLSVVIARPISPTRLRDRCILELMYRAGLRVSEVIGLETRDIDTEQGTVRIAAGKSGDRTAWFDVATVGPLIEEWKRTKSQLGLDRSPWLFCTTRCGHYSPKRGKIRSEPGGQVNVRTVQVAIKRFAKRAGIEGAAVPRRVTPHVLRHTFATELVEENTNIRHVQKRLGHRHLNTTEIYTHVMDADLMREAQRRVHPLAGE